MRIANGVEMLELSANLAFGADLICPTLIWDAEEAILVDAGLPGQLPQFKEAMEKAGVPFGRFKRIVITHHDMDHTGGLSAMLRASPHPIEVLAHEEEVPYIEAERPPLRLLQLEAQMAAMPEPQRSQIKVFYDGLRVSYPNHRAQVDRKVADGEELPDCGGITVIHTPGHTPGHICLYLKPSRTLVAGDALTVRGSTLQPPLPSTVLDPQAARESLLKLARYDIEAVICYHGGLYRGDAGGRIAELARAS
jgi:glyoxylase-like metal-dependent hydrolase (beta-lactamase superfamily II)